MFRRCRKQFSGGCHACKHQQAVGAGEVSAFDVGIKTIADHERALGRRPAHPFSVQRQRRFARDPRLAPGRHRDDADQRAIAGEQTPATRQRAVDVGGNPQRARPYREGGLSKIAVAKLRPKSLHDGVGPFVGRPDHLETGVLDDRAQRGTANNQHSGAHANDLDDQSSRRLRRRHDFLWRRRNAQAGEMAGHRGGVARGVVRDEREPHAERSSLRDRLRRDGNGLWPDVDNAVKIEQADVVRRGEGLRGRAQPRAADGRIAGWITCGHEAPSSRARTIRSSRP